MESLSPSSDNPTPQLECMPCGRVFKYPWHLQQHLSSRKHIGESSNLNRGRNCCPICRKGIKARGLASHMKAAHQYVVEKGAPEEQPKNGPKTNPQVQKFKHNFLFFLSKKLLKVKINEHERAFMRERVLIEERKIAENSKRVEMIQKTAAESQVELTTLQSELEFSNQLVSHFKDMLKR
ncbi:unnamed protein product [Orchesella dallaii]|uniref:C2H2-type domain-containing protein n=1 Tax=Orchesella dallaii TaxID=48710 RepID=A0ABP1QJJ8_9HEXA